MQKSLETIQIDNQDYTYIENHSSFKGEHYSSVFGFTVPIDSKLRNVVENLGGFYRDLTDTIRLDKDENYHTFVVLSITTRAMTTLTGLYFIGEANIEKGLTAETEIAIYLSKRLREEIDVTYINSLEYMRDTEHEELKSLLKDYYSPKRIDDTGLYIDNTMINYGDTLEITDIPKFVDTFNPNTILTKTKIDKAQIVLNKHGEGMMNIIGNFYYVKNGKRMTYLEYVYIEHNNNTYNSFDEFERAMELNTIYEVAIRINENLTDYKKVRPKLKERLIQQYDQTIEKELRENNAPHYDLISIGLLVACINKGLVKFSEEE